MAARVLENMLTGDVFPLYFRLSSISHIDLCVIIEIMRLWTQTTSDALDFVVIFND